MKVAIFTDTYDEINGVASTYHRLVEYAKKKNKKVEIFSIGKKDSVERINKNIKIHRYKLKWPISIYSDLSFDLNWLNTKLIAYFNNNKFDIIHTATPGSMGLNALCISRLFKIPLIGVYHTDLPVYVKNRAEKISKEIKWPDKNASKGWEDAVWNFMKIYYNRCKLVLVPSEFTKKILEKKFVKTKIGIFSRGIDTAKFNPKFEDKSFKREYKIKALYVGRLSVEKNLDLLIKCFKDLKDVKLIIVGDGPYKKEIENKIDAEFLGFLKGKKLSEIYASCSFFVFPSISDTFGNVVLEAMASGLPVIVMNKGGQRELVQNRKNGFIVKNSVKEFKEKVKLLTKNEKLRKMMGINARKSALERNWDNVFNRLFEDYYKELYKNI